MLSQAHKDIPTQFLRSQAKVTASLVLASFGASAGYNSPVFTLDLVTDKSVPSTGGEKSLRYGKLPEIHHIFRPDQTMPNILISTIFTLGGLATIPILLGAVSDHLNKHCLSRTNLFSGSSSGPMLTTFRKLCQMPLLRTLSSLVLLLDLKVSCSCTIRAGICSKLCQYLQLSALSHS